MDTALYVGGVPAHVGPPHPPAMWAATLGLGYVGCVRDLSINGQPVQLSELAEEQDSGEQSVILLIISGLAGLRGTFSNIL